MLDHINNDGAKDRARGLTGFAIYWRLYQEGCPVGLQVLCHNCNWLKEVARRKASREEL